MKLIFSDIMKSIATLPNLGTDKNTPMLSRNEIAEHVQFGTTANLLLMVIGNQGVPV